MDFRPVSFPVNPAKTSETEIHEQVALSALSSKTTPLFIENIKRLFSPELGRSAEEAIQDRERRIREVLSSPSHTIQRVFFAHFGDDASIERAGKVALAHAFD